MEILAGIAVVAFASCVVYAFWMVAQEQKGEYYDE